MSTLSGEAYSVEFDEGAECVRVSGTLRLGGLSEYAPLVELLVHAMEQCETLTLDLRELEFLNSSGIAAMSKFVIRARDQEVCHLVIRGSRAVPWQSKSLNNLKRLMPSLELHID